MNQEYRNGVTKMEAQNIDPEYVLGWQGGFLGHPEREQQRLSNAYSAGYADGREKLQDNFAKWTIS